MESIFKHTGMSLRTLLFAVLFAIPVHYFVVQPYRVSDNTMSPEFSKGDVILINRFRRFQGKFERNDVVLVRKEDDYSSRALRTIVGLPEERLMINDGILSLRGEKEYTKELPLFGSIISSIADKGRLDGNEYFMMSNTSIEKPTGIVDERFIVGVPFLKVWPIKSIKVL